MPDPRASLDQELGVLQQEGRFGSSREARKPPVLLLGCESINMWKNK